jgi:hypothetical protein
MARANCRAFTVYHTLAITPSTTAGASYFMSTRQQASLEAKQTLRRSIMKTILSALVALSFVAGAVAPAAAYESFSIKQLDQDNRGGHNYGGSVIEQLDREGRGGHNT